MSYILSCSLPINFLEHYFEIFLIIESMKFVSKYSNYDNIVLETYSILNSTVIKVIKN